MLETVVKPAVCQADAKHSTGSTLKYSTRILPFRPGLSNNIEGWPVKTSRWKIENFFYRRSRHSRMLSANHVDRIDRKKVYRESSGGDAPRVQSRIVVSILGKAANSVIEVFDSAKTTSNGSVSFNFSQEMTSSMRIIDEGYKRKYILINKCIWQSCIAFSWE